MFGDSRNPNRDVRTKHHIILIQMCLYIHIYIFLCMDVFLRKAIYNLVCNINTSIFILYVRLYGRLLEDDDLSLNRVNGLMFMDKL